ncbi:MAG: hypothetical protein DRO40_12635 [Thermoprotei archaeon]|nr:MAG: hypothetical protein DRO40_12635 [Thermoprotei archaeon]
MEHNVICEEGINLIILKIIVSDNKSISEDILEKIRDTIRPLCVILDNYLIELWLCIELSKLHEIVYKIITLMNIPVNVYVSSLYGIPQPLLVNGVYNRSVRLEPTVKANVDRRVISEENIELLCYDEFHKCLDKAYMLLRNGKIKVFAVRKEGTRCRIIARLSKPVCVTELVKQCLRIAKPKLIPL